MALNYNPPYRRACYLWLIGFFFLVNVAVGQSIFFADGTSGKRICWHPRNDDPAYVVEVEVEPGRCGDGNYVIVWGDNTPSTKVEKAGIYTHTYNFTSFRNSTASGVQVYNIVLESTADECFFDQAPLVRLIAIKTPVPRLTVTAACEDVQSTFTNTSEGRTANNYHTLSWSWEFSDGKTYTTAGTLRRTFDDPDQTYTVKLGVKSDVCTNDFVYTEPVSFKLKKLPTTVAEVQGLGDGVLCYTDDSDSTIVLDASKSRDANQFNWRITGGDYEVVDLMKSDSSQMKIKLTESATYQIQIRTRNECGLAQGSNATFSTTFDALPLPDLTLLPQTDGCEELTYKLTDPDVGASYFLYRAGVPEPLEPGVEVVLPVSEEPYRVEGVVENVCGERRKNISFYVHPKAPVEITSIPLDTTVCYATESISLEASRLGGAWMGEGLRQVSGQTIFTPDVVGEFEITYQLGTGLCLTADTRRIKVINELPQASIGLDETDLRCSPAVVLFTNRSKGADPDYSLWRFDDSVEGIVTSSDTISWVFSAEETEANYVVRLTVRNACGTVDATRNIKILPQTIKPYFSFPPGVFCPNSAIPFEDGTVPEPTHWYWNFGNQGESNLKDPKFSFPSPGTYEVTLTAGNQCATDSVKHTVEIQVPPDPEFTITNDLLCEGQEVSFNNSSDTRYTFAWDFGDGSPADETNFNPSHVFNAAGTYEVKLTIFDGSKECSSETSLPIFVNSVFQASFTPEVDELACEPALVKFVNHTEGADQWYWEFSDGNMTRTATVKEPLIPFTKGYYTFHLTATREGACPAEASGFAYFDFVKCNVDIPEAFTPNGDLHGDRYTLFGDGIDRIIFMKIRNRWSEVVFEAQDIPPGSQADGESWDGTKNGKPLPADMYVVEAKVRYKDQSESEVIRSNFYLVR